VREQYLSDLEQRRKAMQDFIASAAAAVSANGMLWTRNRKHYPMKELNFFDAVTEPRLKGAVRKSPDPRRR
jgi:hypothetical protein